MSVVGDPLGFPFPAAARRSGWRRRGTELNNQARELVERAHAVLGAEVAIGELDVTEPGRATEIVSTLTWLCIDRLRSRSMRRVACSDHASLVSDLQQLALDLYEHETACRSRRLAESESALARLRGMKSSADLVERVCHELVESCGFGRALLSRVEDGIWKPWIAHFSEEMPEWFDEWLDTGIPLTAMTLESTLLREHRAQLVHDTSSRRVHTIVRSGMSNSYVVAPITPAGRVVGFLHADHHPSEQRCDEIDRDVLWAFAERFGHIYERTVLLERLRSQRHEVTETLATVETLMTQLSESELELAAHPDSSTTETRAVLSVVTTMSGNLEDLTAREAEVLELMVAGATNAAIAEQLIISEGTVKSHVKHILRKLGAVNRSQAIAHYLGMTADSV